MGLNSSAALPRLGQILGGAVAILAVVLGIALRNTFAIALVGGFLFSFFILSRLRMHTLTMALVLEVIVLGQFGFGANTLWGMRAGYVDIFLLFTGGLLLVRRLSVDSDDRPEIPGVTFWLAWVVFLILSVLAHPDVWKDGMRHLQFLALTPFIAYFVGLTILRQKNQVLLLLFGLAFLYLGLGIYYLYVLNSALSSVGYEAMRALIEVGQKETNVIFVNKNITGSIFLVGLPFFVGAFMDSQKFSFRLLFLIASTLSLICVLATLSRGNLAALIIAPSITALLFARNPIRAVIPVASFLVLVLTALVVTGTLDLYMQRFSEGGEQIDYSRVELIRISFNALFESPFFGLGLSEQAFIDQIYRMTHSSILWAHPHNSYLQIAVFAGVPALLAFLLLIGRLFRNLISLRKMTGHVWMNWGMTTGVLAFLVVMLTDFMMFRPYSALVFWVFFTIAIAWERLMKLDAASAELS